MGRRMSRQAVERGFEAFVDDVVDLAYEEFDVAAALRRGTRGGGSRVVGALVDRSDALDRAVVRPELRAYRSSVLEQFDVVVEYAADPDATVSDYADRILAADVYADALRPGLPADRREAVRRDLLERQRRLGDAIVPLLDADENEFWPAVAATFDREEARTFVETHFEFTAPVLEHRGAFRFETEVDAAEVVGGLLGRGLPTVTVEYTDEAVRTLRSAERTVVRETLSELDRRYG